MANRLSSAQVTALYEMLSNWGRWGKEDQRGALNFITDAKRAAAARLVKSGEAVSLALPLATIAAADNPTPVTHLMVQAGFDSHEMPLPYAGDYFAIAPHGMANTHLDALCHVFYKGKMYNGFDAAEVGSHGAARCDLSALAPRAQDRGAGFRQRQRRDPERRPGAPAADSRRHPGYHGNSSDRQRRLR